MIIDNLFAVIASVCLIVLSIFVGIVFYGVAIDWDSVSVLILGVYLYQAYLLLSILSDKPKTGAKFQGRASHKKNQKVSDKEAYEH